MGWPQIENPMVLFRECEEEPKALETCESCKCDLFHGDRYFKIDGVYYCEDCVEEGELDGEDYMPEEDCDGWGDEEW